MALFATFNTIPLEGMPTFFYPNLFPIHISSSPVRSTVVTLKSLPPGWLD